MFNLVMAIMCILTTCVSSAQAIEEHQNSVFTKADGSHQTITLPALDNIDLDDDAVIDCVAPVTHCKALKSTPNILLCAIEQPSRDVSIRAPPLEFI